jgi:triacylglycerol esterase/lipase EstA (alpha/beta hydrolase family)
VRIRPVIAPVLSALALVAAAVVPAQADSGPAGADSGPALSVPQSALDASLRCSGDLRGASSTPVLLVPGTTLTPDVNFDWNYEKVFTAQGRPWCAVTLPNHAMTDIQVAGEYVTDAIRTMHTRADRTISVLGFSQGGMVPRWSLKFWPDTRAMVDDMISLDPSNHGTLDAYPTCTVGGCAPALWQQQTGSRFLAALNKDAETYAGISYSQVYTATDEVVVPNVPPAASSRLTTGRGTISNTLVQSICPVHVSEHLSMGTSDPVGYALAMDALTHPGPAQASRISRSVCLQTLFPGIDPVAYPSDFSRVAVSAATQVLLAPHVPAEPALAAYAR